MLLSDTKLIEIFCDCDDFCKMAEKYSQSKQLDSGKRKPTIVPGFSLSECMCIMISYHHSGMKCFQYYYEDIVKKHMISYFPKCPSYSHFLELIPITIMMLFLFVNLFRQGEATDCYFADSKKLPVCDNLRIRSNKVFIGNAGRSKSSTGWFYGLKLFLVINPYGQLLYSVCTETQKIQCFQGLSVDKR